jgi:hypothetical protein
MLSAPALSDNPVWGLSPLVWAGLVEAFFASAVCSLPASRVSPRRATYFSLRRQRNLRKRKATRLSGSLRFAPGNLRCSIPAGVGRTRLRLKQLPPLTPPPSALLGPAKRALGNEGGCGETKTRKARLRRRPVPVFVLVLVSAPPPVGPGRGAQAKADQGSRLSEPQASSSETPLLASTAGCPEAQRRGPGPSGRLFFGDFLLATQKKVTCRRATPGQRSQAHPRTCGKATC